MDGGTKRSNKLNGAVGYITFLQSFLCPGSVGKEAVTYTSATSIGPLDNSINWMRLH